MTDAALHPLHALTGLVQHVFIVDNLYLSFALLLPFVFLPVRRVAWLGLAAFVALPVLASTDPNFHSPAFHYGAPIVPFLLLASAGCLARWEPDLRRVKFVAAPLAAIGIAGFGPLGTRTLTASTVNIADARAAVATIRPGDGVAAANAFGPHLADRELLLPFPFPFVDVPLRFPLDPRVTSTSAKSQEGVDVVIGVAPARGEGGAMETFMDSDVARNEFELTRFGDVLVFRRIT